MSSIDIAVLFIYLIGVVAFGCWFVRRSGTPTAFMAAGSALPGWAVGLSIFGTYLSSNSFVGLPGKAFGTNWNAFVFSLSLPIAAVIAVAFFVPFYRRSGQISAYHHLEERFGPWARTYATVCYLLTQIARIGTVLYGVSLALTALTKWDIQTIILVSGIVITTYTVLGGIEAVIWTDVVQSIILMGGALVVLGILLFGMPGGPQQAFDYATQENKFSLGSFAMDFTTSTFWVVLLYGLFINLNNFGIDQSFVQRYHTAKTDADASRSVWLGALLYVPISAVFLLIGTSLNSYYHAKPELMKEVKTEVAKEKGKDASELTDKDVGDHAFPYFLAHGLPAGVAGLLIAALFAAAMSSIDTSMNSSATVILSDLYKRYVHPDISDRGSMRVLYLATIGMGVCGMGVAIAMIGAKSLLDSWWKLSGIFAGGMLGLFLLGIIAKSAGNVAGMIGVIVGLLVIAWMSLSSWLPPMLRHHLHSNMIIVIGTLTIFAVGLLASQFLGKRNRDLCDSDQR